MNFIHKFIIPLLDKRLTLDDISEDVGFCGMATYDPNRPYLDNHIFLVYSMVMTNKAIAVRKKLASLGIHNKIDCRIQGKPYRVFCFPIIGKSILNLTSNVIGLTDDELMQVYKFWKFTDSEMNKYMLNNQYMPELFKELKVPEFDFSPKDLLKFDKKGWTLDYQCSPFIFYTIRYMNNLDRITLRNYEIFQLQICFYSKIYQNSKTRSFVLYLDQKTKIQQVLRFLYNSLHQIYFHKAMCSL